MASEYLLKKAREQAPPPEPRPLTPEEKRRNWWYYHKWHVTVGVVLVLSLASILFRALGIGQTRPDYTVAYVGSVPLSDETVQALRSGLAALSTDLNGDGKVSVALEQYTAVDTGDSDSLYYAQAAQVQLVADITECKSYFFLLEDPEAFQKDTSALCYLDGTLPADTDHSAQGKYLYWGDCPGLTSVELGEDGALISRLAFARRGFWTEKTVDNVSGCDVLWRIFTEGANES